MVLHYAINGAQAQARALADRLGRIKGIEDTMRIFDSRAIVGKLHDHLSRFELGADAEHTASGFFERVEGVFDDLHEHLKELMAVTAHLRKVGSEREFDMNFLV